MANGTGYNPQGLSFEGKEGSGMAQIFQPYDSGKYNNAKAEQAQAKAAKDAKDKADRAKTIKYNPIKREESWFYFNQPIYDDWKRAESGYTDAYLNYYNNPDDEQAHEAYLKAKLDVDNVNMMAQHSMQLKGSYDKQFARAAQGKLDGTIDLDATIYNLDKAIDVNDPEFKKKVEEEYGGNYIAAANDMINNATVYTAQAFDTKDFYNTGFNISEQTKKVSGWTNFDDVPDDYNGDFIAMTVDNKQVLYPADTVKKWISDTVAESEKGNSKWVGAIPFFEEIVGESNLPNDWDKKTAREKGDWFSEQGEVYSRVLKNSEFISKKNMTKDSGSDGGSGGVIDYSAFAPDNTGSDVTIRTPTEFDENAINHLVGQFGDSKFQKVFGFTPQEARTGVVEPKTYKTYGAQTVPNKYLNNKSGFAMTFSNDLTITDMSGNSAQNVNVNKGFNVIKSVETGVRYYYKGTSQLVSNEKLDGMSEQEKKNKFESKVTISGTGSVGEGMDFSWSLPIDYFPNINDANKEEIKKLSVPVIEAANSNLYDEFADYEEED